MIDDLVTKGVEDPYRMLTARAEHRLLLRHDNADLRLTPLAIDLGTACDLRRRRLEAKREGMARLQTWLEETYVKESENEVLARFELAPVKNRASLFDLLRRPHVSLALVERLAEQLELKPGDVPAVPDDVEAYGHPARQARQQVEIGAVYHGYLQRQDDEAELARRLDTMPIPDGFEFAGLKGLSYESVEKLSRIRPSTVGQAGRIPGVRPADVALLIGHLRSRG